MTPRRHCTNFQMSMKLIFGNIFLVWCKSIFWEGLLSCVPLSNAIRWSFPNESPKAHSYLARDRWEELRDRDCVQLRMYARGDDMWNTSVGKETCNRLFFNIADHLHSKANCYDNLHWYLLDSRICVYPKMVCGDKNIYSFYYRPSYEAHFNLA